MTVGLPLPKGLSSDCGSWTLSRPDGQRLPLQTRVLNRWSDGSIRWVLLDFQASADEGTETLAVLACEGGGGNAFGQRTIVVSQSQCGVIVDTGAARFDLAAGSGGPWRAVSCGGHEVLDVSRSWLRVLDANNTPCQVLWEAPRLEEPGKLRAVVRADGKIAGRGFGLDLVARLHFFAGSAVVRLDLTIRNPRRAAHPGGIWELGDSGSVLLREVALVMARLPGDPCDRIAWSAEPGSGWNESSDRVEIYQESSGGENWRSRAHVNRNGEIPLRFAGYELVADESRATGRQASPVVVTSDGLATLGATIRHFWENFPKGIEATPGDLTLSLFPGRFADVHELQGGEQKTHECWLAFGPDAVTAKPLEWCRSPLLAHATPEWYAGTGAVPWLTPAASDPHVGYLALVNGAIEGGESFVAKRERADEYGWRNFGDIHADHEATLSANPADFVSHYNNQYDALNGLAVHFLRSGDARWWYQMDELARHVVDIDIYHTDEDKSAYNHGLFWHSAHYTDAGRSTHRTYPRAPGIAGGGPSNEHDYATGLLHHYLLTGCERSREAVLELAGWVIDMDDGRKTVFRWLDTGDTGLASATGSTLYHGPGRGAANSIQTLLNAHLLTGEARYLTKAEQLIRRCIHPEDDIESLDLLNAEQRWYYTVFLQALGRYLHCKAELGQLDQMYIYARASLLHYARWMVPHEYPYLEKPEILDYPNETWAAQDIRKSEVFDLASMHASGGERERFKERSEFFFRYSTETVSGMTTHALTRPTVLMLSYGWWHAFSLLNAGLAMPMPLTGAGAWGEPRAFIPQKVRATRRARRLTGVACALLLAAAAIALVVCSR